jgi:hypothetical protein
MSEPAFELFPGFKTPPNDPKLYVAERNPNGEPGYGRGWSEWPTELKRSVFTVAKELRSDELIR